MQNTKKLGDYFYGLRTFLELCENSFGPNGQPFIIPSRTGNEYQVTKDSKTLFQSIGSSSDNALVKMVINFALEQYQDQGDHSLYMVIVAINAFFRLSLESIPVQQILQELNEVDIIIEGQMRRQTGFHNVFDPDFQSLVQLCISLVTPKLFGFTTSKLESFSKFVVAALLQAMPDSPTGSFSSWLEPKVLVVPMVSKDPYHIGEVYEGLLFPIENNGKITKHLQRVVELRSFVTYETLYKEKKKLNSVLMSYNKSKLLEVVSEQTLLNKKYDLPHLKESIFETIENNFVSVLERSNVGLIISQNKLSYSFRSKLSDIGIFVIDSLNDEHIDYAVRVFGVEVISSLTLEDAEGYLFQVEIPTFRTFNNLSYVAIPRSKAVILILYVVLTSGLDLDEKLASWLFAIIGKILFANYRTKKESERLRMLCHGAGCTEMLVAGMILRIGDNDRSNNTNFWTTKASNIHNTVKQVMASSLIRVFQLTHELGDHKKWFTEDCDPLNFCRHNLSCVCGSSKGLFGARYNQVLDITEVKAAAIKKAILLLKILMKMDSILLVE